MNIMKITTHNQTPYVNKTYTIKTNNLNYTKQNYKNDVFVKSKVTSFKGLSSFAQKYEPFEKELHRFYRQNENMNYDAIQKFIKNYVPKVEVKKLSEIDANANVNSRTAAYFKDQMFINQGGVTNGVKELYINLPQSNSKEDKLTFAGFLLHEITHAFQELSTDRLSKFEWLKKFVEKSPLDNDKMLTIRTLPKFFASVEQNMNTPLYETLKKTSELPEKVPVANKNIVDYIYLQATGVPVANYTDYIVNKTAQHIGLPQKPENQIKLLEYLIQMGKKEGEAYQNTTNFYKKDLDINYPVDLDLRTNLYDMFTDRIKEYL